MNDGTIELDIVYHVGFGDTQLSRDDSSRFRAAAKWISDRFGLIELIASIAIVDDETIQLLNREHLDHDWPTDVISFAFGNAAGVVEGEVIASAETAGRICSEAGWSASDELLLYVVHGLLHLAGMDDCESEGRREMRQMEGECLLALGVPFASEHVRRWDQIFNR